MLQPSMPLLHVATWIAASSMKGSVLIGAVAFLRCLLPPAAASPWRHALWLPVLVCLLCPLGPHVPLAMPGQSARPEAVAAGLTASSAAIQARIHAPLHARLPGAVTRASLPAPQATLANARRPAPAPRRATFGSFLPWLMLLWAAGAVVLASLYLRNLLKFRRIRLAARALKGSSVRVFEACRAELGVRRPVRLLESRQIDSPVLFGWWRPALLLPLGLNERLDGSRLRHVLLHELAHVKRADVLVNWLAACAQLLHWFNPLVWLAVRLMRSDMESACDARVLRHLCGDERDAYGEMLVQLSDAQGAEIALIHGLGIADRYTDLKGRLTMIARFRPTSIRTKLAASLALATFTSVALTQPGFGPDSPSKPGTAHELRLAAAPQDAAHASAAAAEAGSVPLRLLIERVAANIHQRVVVDPDAQSSVVLFGQKLDQITYADFLTILRVNGFTAIELNNYVQVVPIGQARWMPLPTVAKGKELPDDQFANMAVAVKNACAPRLIPILRPLMPQWGHLVADPNSNTILAVDTYANLKRIRSFIAEFDARTKPGLGCGGPAR